MNDTLNVLQSILLPFALIPILQFCAMPSVSRKLNFRQHRLITHTNIYKVMGDFATGKFWTIFGPIVSLVVIAINVYFTYQIISGYESIATFVVVGVIGSAYTVFVVYLCYLYWTEALYPSLRTLFCAPRDDEEILIQSDQE